MTNLLNAEAEIVDAVGGVVLPVGPADLTDEMR